jgi:alkanesulfonate monooxygenase SsuD/methylene tetrahydromethanopterin reductase-like flavin-dependent oxidoreductase (luciferase family)
VSALARIAERAGWDAFDIWDTLEHEGKPAIDPWIALAACAMTTTRIGLGPMVVSTARRRPWKLAREAATLQQLSRGRLILALGAGYRDVGFAAFGEDATPSVKFAKLDEAMALLDELLAGKPVRRKGRYYNVKTGPFLPVPPRIPVWIALSGTGRSELARASRADGALGQVAGRNTDRILRFVARHRRRPGGFDLIYGIHERRSADDMHAFIMRARAAGATWLRYEVGSIFDTVDEVGPARRFIRRGPPR